MQPQGRVVVVDDEPVILDLLVTVLEDGPWTVSAFRRGVDAQAHLREHGADVLLTDKNLPDLGGLELIAQLKRSDPDAECVVITGYPSLDTALEAMQLSVFDYIVKPPRSIFEVRQKVERAWETVRIVRENRRLLDALTTRNAELTDALEQLSSAQAEVIQSEKLAGIGTLAAGVAHEVASPLFGILGLAEAIVDETDIDTAHAHAREIVSYSKHIRNIVAELTRYSRSGRGEGDSPVDVAEAVQAAVRLVERSLGVASDRIAVSVPSDLSVLGRRGELQQVFVNLVKNAIEASDGPVRVVGLAQDDQVVIRVEDDGVGIAAADIPQVFDPFFTTKAPGEGTGLGLNVVYRIITRCRGSVSVDSAEGEGTTVTLRLPRVGAA